jgi:hypothetical protein
LEPNTWLQIALRRNREQQRAAEESVDETRALYFAARVFNLFAWPFPVETIYSGTTAACKVARDRKTESPEFVESSTPTTLIPPLQNV